MNIDAIGVDYNENLLIEINDILSNYIGRKISQYTIKEIENEIPKKLKYICHRISDEKLYVYQNQIYIPYWNKIFPEISKQYKLNRNGNYYISDELTEENLFYLKLKYDFYEGFWNFNDDIKILVKDF